MNKLSFKKIFKKSESAKSGKGGKLLLPLLLILLIGAGAYLGYPLLFPDKPAFEPTKITITSNPSLSNTVKEKEEEPIVEEKTRFDIEVEQRELGYKEKIFNYMAYEPPSIRNPFQKVASFYIPSEIVNIVNEEQGGEDGQGTQQGTSRFNKPELPPGTLLTGIIDSPGKKVAIIEMNEEVYIANLYDILSDRYIVKEIKKDEVIIDLNGTFFSLKIGGEGLSDEL